MSEAAQTALNVPPKWSAPANRVSAEPPPAPVIEALPNNLKLPGQSTGLSPRRAYLNQKFGRSGNLDLDINARGINDAIRANADLATGRAVAEAAPGATPGAIGTRAHQIFERLNNRLANRVAGSYRIGTEEFRNAAGVSVAPRSAGSISADVYYRPWANPGAAPTIFDLKTYGTTPTPISATRQLEFLRRFGSPATEIFMQR